MLGDIGKMMQQVKEMKAGMKVAQKELQSMQIEGASKNKEVKFIVNGEMDIKEVQISPESMSLKVEDMEKAVLFAIRDAIGKAKKMAADKLGKLTGGMNLPGM
ncbi:MAG: YbaB/EbfC family nucleoid-associated protein [Candidatus Margulisiibacteriota bacterium]